MMEDRLQAFLAADITPNLSIAVANAQETVYRFHAGRFSFERDEPIHAQTRFDVGSTTKMFTAALLLKLVENGEVTLDDPVRRYVPEFDIPQITLAHLLTHTSGLRDRPLKWPVNGRIRAYLDTLYAKLSWHALPGQQHAYYSAGYTMLMDVIERVAGRPMEAFARETLFDPLGMAHTTYDTASLAAGTFTFPCQRSRPDNKEDVRLAAIGETGLHSTAEDLVRFGRMVLNKGKWEGVRIYLEPTIDQMFRERTAGRHAFSALGMLKSAENPHRCFSDQNSPETVGHPGYSGCMLWIDPVYGLTGAIVTNSEDLHADWRHYRVLISLSIKRALEG